MVLDGLMGSISAVRKCTFGGTKLKPPRALQMARTTQPVHNTFIWAECLEEDHDTSRNLQEKVQIDGGHVHSDSIHDATHGVLVKEPILMKLQDYKQKCLKHKAQHPDSLDF